MLVALTRREVQDSGKKLAQQHGPHFRMAESGERVSGFYRQSVKLVSGKYALVKRSQEFTLVPWAASHREGAGEAGILPSREQQHLLGSRPQARARRRHVGCTSNICRVVWPHLSSVSAGIRSRDLYEAVCRAALTNFFRG